MTKENAKDYLPLVQALAEGKTIQRRSHIIGKIPHETDTWEDCTYLDCSDDPSYFRLKPEPRRWWLVWTNNSGPHVHHVPQQESMNNMVIEVMEVIK